MSRQVIFEMFIVWMKRSYVALDRFFLKKYLQLYLTQTIHSNGKMLFAWEKKLFIKVSMVRRSRSVFRTRQQVTCKMFISKAFGRLSWKNYISGYIWHKLSIHTVKCSFFSQIIVYPIFYSALLTFIYFLLQGKVLCFARVGKSLARCLFPKRSEDLLEKIISPLKFDTNCSFKQ